MSWWSMNKKKIINANKTAIMLCLSGKPRCSLFSLLGVLQSVKGSFLEKEDFWCFIYVSETLKFLLLFLANSTSGIYNKQPITQKLMHKDIPWLHYNHENLRTQYENIWHVGRCWQWALWGCKRNHPYSSKNFSAWMGSQNSTRWVSKGKKINLIHIYMENTHNCEFWRIRKQTRNIYPAF